MLDDGALSPTAGCVAAHQRKRTRMVQNHYTNSVYAAPTTRRPNAATENDALASLDSWI